MKYLTSDRFVKTLIRKCYWALLSSIAGVLAGFSSSVFLFSLDWATHFRDQHSYIILALPLVGFFIGWLYWHFGGDSSGGNNLIIDEIHHSKKVLPLRMAPLVLIGTLLTHLFGGSVGREGTAVQMSASLSDQLSRFLKITEMERKALLMAAVGAGFGTALGAPWAGFIFGMEVVNVGRLRLFAVFECLIASVVGYYVTQLLQAPHSHFSLQVLPPWSYEIIFWVLLAGVFFGLAAWSFTHLTHAVERLLIRGFAYPPLRPLVGGLVVTGLFYLEGTFRFVGLGIPEIQHSLVARSTYEVPFLKAIFTALTIGSGFKGGEFVPLVFIGATLGSALGIWIPVAFSLLARVGFVAVFAGAANTPIACTVLAMEIFGWEIGPYALVACFASYCFSGPSGIYKSQKKDINKLNKFPTQKSLHSNSKVM